MLLGIQSKAPQGTVLIYSQLALATWHRTAPTPTITKANVTQHWEIVILDLALLNLEAASLSQISCWPESHQKNLHFARLHFVHWIG